MCEGCKDIVVQNKPVIRQAAFKHRNDFVEVNELISIIHYKFFNWKSKQEGPVQVNNSFFHRIAHNAAIDELEEYNLSLDDPKHLKLINETQFHDPTALL